MQPLGMDILQNPYSFQFWFINILRDLFLLSNKCSKTSLVGNDFLTMLIAFVYNNDQPLMHFQVFMYY
ncbi:hypothetical protein DP73_13680 [Desulfosporosinus sp. HMP52]|nr:hypothetical protein DP73_13680 [Desulfosporosinus sp. HMP52]